MNEQTPHLGLPLPHPANDLGSDVLRLRDALQALDGHVSALQTALQSDDVALDQLQELVDAIKANRGDIAGLLSVKADASALQAEVAARQAEDQALLESLEAEVSARQQADAALQAALSTVSAEPSAVSYTYDTQGRLIGMSETLPSGTRATAYSYNAAGQVATVTVTLGTSTRTTTYAYNASGALTGTTTTESRHV